MQRAAVIAAQHAGEGRLWCGDAVRDVAALLDPYHLRAEGVGEPDSALGIERASVGCCARDLRPLAPITQRRVVVDRERDVITTERLADDQGATVGRDHRPVRECERGGGDLRAAVGAYQRQVGRLELTARFEVEPEVADIDVAVGVDDHVVAVPGGDVGQVGVLDQRAVAVVAHDPAARHEHDDECAVGQPADARRAIVEPAERRRALATGSDAVDRALVEVGVPQRPVVPARAFTEVDPVDE